MTLKLPTSVLTIPLLLLLSCHGGASYMISNDLFNQFFSQRTASGCPSKGFYTYAAFKAAAAAYPRFGTTGSADAQKRELAAFFANAAHETQRGCYIEQIDKSGDPKYYGRGPLMLTGQSNYQAAGQAIGFDGVNNPGKVASDATVSFKTAVWYWMTQHSPTCHAAITGNQGFGATIKAINGGLECGAGANKAEQQDRISLYKSFCSSINVAPGPNLSC